MALLGLAEDAADDVTPSAALVSCATLPSISPLVPRLLLLPLLPTSVAASEKSSAGRKTLKSWLSPVLLVVSGGGQGPCGTQERCVRTGAEEYKPRVVKFDEADWTAYMPHSCLGD